MFKVKISGYYRSGKYNVDFNTEVAMPECDEEYIQSNVMYRMLPMVMASAEKPFTAHGVCYVDKVTKDDKMVAGYNGKEIRDMEWSDIEEVAIEYNLRSVPLYRGCSLREARERLYKEYSREVLDVDCDKDINYSYDGAPNIVVGVCVSNRKPEEPKVAPKAAPKKAAPKAAPQKEVAVPEVKDDFQEQVDSLQKEFAGE